MGDYGGVLQEEECFGGLSTFRNLAAPTTSPRTCTTISSTDYTAMANHLLPVHAAACVPTLMVYITFPLPYKTLRIDPDGDLLRIDQMRRRRCWQHRRE